MIVARASAWLLVVSLVAVAGCGAEHTRRSRGPSEAQALRTCIDRWNEGHIRKEWAGALEERIVEPLPIHADSQRLPDANVVCLRCSQRLRAELEVGRAPEIRFRDDLGVGLLLA